VKLYILIFIFILSSCDSINKNNNTVNTIKTQLTLSQKIFNSNYCNKIIDNSYIKICYSYDKKAAKAVEYTLNGDLVNAVNIKMRPRFYSEPTLPPKYRATYYDYKNSGYERGHMAPDAAFDWSDESLHAVYTLANIIPQIPDVNEHTWVKAEEHARKEAVIHGKITVINIVKYDTNSPKIGDNNISVSKGFYKIMYNKDENYKECFYYKNEANTSRSLTTHQIDCKDVKL